MTSAEIETGDSEFTPPASGVYPPYFDQKPHSESGPAPLTDVESSALTTAVEAAESARAALGGRAKSSLRLKYEVEAELLKRKLGDLEAIRSELGLTKRKICQLLLVDPSAWTRWTQGTSEPPPHIYRMLQWYLAVNDKYPALDVNFWLQNIAREKPVSSGEVEMLHQRVSALKAEIAELKSAQMEHRLAANPEISFVAGQKYQRRQQRLMGSLMFLLGIGIGALVFGLRAFGSIF